MALTFQNKIQITTLSLKPGITVWYSKISEITDSIFIKGRYHNYRPVMNEIFGKDDFIKPFLSGEEIRTINGFKALKKTDRMDMWPISHQTDDSRYFF